MRTGGSCEKEDERSAEDEGVHVKLMDALVPVASKLSLATGEHKKEGKRRKEGQLGTRGEGGKGRTSCSPTRARLKMSLPVMTRALEKVYQRRLK